MIGLVTNGPSFLETNCENLTGLWLKVVGVEKFESESPLLSSKNEAGGGVGQKSLEFIVFWFDDVQTGSKFGGRGGDVAKLLGVTS